MKNTLLLLLGMICFIPEIIAQSAPQAIPYQAIIRDNQGNPKPNFQITMKFSILDGSSNGTAVFAETQSLISNPLGLIVAEIGRGTVVQGNFSAIDWGGSAKYLKVEGDTIGGIYFTFGTQELLSVPYALYSGGTSNWMRVMNDLYSLNPGKVGIGTTNPLHKLDVRGNLFVGTRNPTNFTTMSTGDAIYLGDSRSYLANYLGDTINGSYNWVNLMCHPFSAGIILGLSGPDDTDPHSAPVPLMTLGANGKSGIGMGAFNPDGVFHIKPDQFIDELVVGENLWNVNDAANRIQLGNSTSSVFLRIGQSNSSYASLGWIYNPDSTLAYAHYSTQGIYQPLVLQRDGGNLGIATVTPAARLHVGNVSDQNALRLGSRGDIFDWNYYVDVAGLGSLRLRDGNNNPKMCWVAGGGGQVGVGTENPSAMLSVNGTLAIGSNFSSRLYWFSQNIFSLPPNSAVFEGNVGIGTLTPAEKLSVSGNICYTGSIAACSDIRYKKTIAPLTHCLDNVSRLQGVSYYWKQDEFPDKQFKDKKEIGVIAQEVEKIYPELVITDANGYKSVDYSKFTPILIEAMKELIQQKDYLEKRVATLENENSNMRSDLDLIKTKLGIEAKAQK